MKILFILSILLLPLFSYAKIQRLEIFQVAAPTNVSTDENQGGPTCYLAFRAPANSSPTAHWAFSTRQGWTVEKPDRNVQSPVPAASCTSAVCTATQVIDGLNAGITYYFAAQEVDETTGKPGRWSNEVACATPGSQADSQTADSQE